MRKIFSLMLATSLSVALLAGSSALLSQEAKATGFTMHYIYYDSPQHTNMVGWEIIDFCTFPPVTTSGGQETTFYTLHKHQC